MSDQNLTVVPFSFEARELRAIIDADGYRWFPIAELLERSGSATKVTDAAESVRDALGDEFVNDVPIPDALGRHQSTLIVREEGATFLLSRMRTEEGKRLNRYIHVEVLPAIRKDGGYIAPDATQEQLKRLEVRARGKQVRNTFTDTLQAHGVHGAGYALCTDAINTPILGAPAALAKKQRGLPVRANLRDNLSSEELTAISLAEEVAKRRIKAKDVRGNRPCASECCYVATAIAGAIA